VQSDYSGTVENISDVTGNVLVREPSIPVEVKAYIRGKIADILPDEGVIVESRGAMVQGIFGVGGERTGTIRVACGSHNQVLDENCVKDDDAGKILVGGSGMTAEASRRLAGSGSRALSPAASRIATSSSSWATTSVSRSPAKS
jgi:hypothetical protein